MLLFVAFLLLLFDKLLLRKYAPIETVHDQLKNSSQIKHSHYRPVAILWATGLPPRGLIAYTH